MPENCLTSLLETQGFRVKRLESGFYKGQNAVAVHLERVKKGRVCGKCGQTAPQGYDSAWREVQRLMPWRHVCFLRFERYRVNCPRCGIRTEALDFVEVRGPRVTRRMARLTAELCKVMTNKSVGLFQALHRGTVKEIDKRSMAGAQANRPLDGIWRSVSFSRRRRRISSTSFSLSSSMSVCRSSMEKR